MRSKIVAGNWKMNLTFEEADNLVNDILDRFEEQDEMKCEVIGGKRQQRRPLLYVHQDGNALGQRRGRTSAAH